MTSIPTTPGRLIALFLVSLATVWGPDAAARSGTFFLPLAPAAAQSVKSASAPGVRSGATAVRLNGAELFGLAYLEEVRLDLPSGSSYIAVRELVTADGDGVTSWVGFIKGTSPKDRVIVTSGPGGAYGVIDTPDGSWRLLPGGEFEWLVDMTEEQKYLPIVGLGNDGILPPPEARYAPIDPGNVAVEAAIPGKNSLAPDKAAPTPQAVVDIMFVVTQGFATKLGTNLATRLAFLVTRANTSYADSEIAIRLRHVNTTTVSYADTTDNLEALRNVSPLHSGFNSAVFGNIESIRNSVGADMVALMLSGNDFGGSGIAWVGSASPHPAYMYSVTKGCMASCESVFIHEVGHNMGNMHDRATVAWQDGGTPNYDAGAFPYSYGYAFCRSGALSCNPEVPAASGGCSSQPECSTQNASNFADIMAYFHGTTSRLYKFSNPNVNCASASGDGIPRPCGVSESSPKSANTALSMNNNRLALSALKPTVILGPTLTVAKAGSGSGTVTSSPAGISCGSTCSASFDDGAAVSLTAAAFTGSSFSGWSGACTGTSGCTVTMSAARSVTATFGTDPAFEGNVRTVVTTFYQDILGRAPDAGGLSFWAGEAVRVAGLGADVKEVFYALAMQFFASAEYVGRNTSNAQYVADMYKTFFRRAPSAAESSFWQGELTAVQSRSALLNSFLFAQEFSNAMAGLFPAPGVRPEVNMTMDLYRGAYGRLPDSAGFNGWLGVIRQAQCQGSAQVSAALNSVLGAFFNSPEYGNRARSDRDFLGDVYNAYMRRGPGGDTAGFNFWVGQVALQGRDGVRSQFVPSAEFQARVAQIVAAGCFGG